MLTGGVATGVARAVRDGGVAIVLADAPGTRPVELREPLRALAAELLAAFGATLDTDARGRPVVSGADLRVSLSYTAGTAAVALATGPRIGVDVEAPRPLDRLDRVVRFVSDAAERAAAPADPAARLDWFYRLWTRKEAVLKAWGTGFGVPPIAVRLPAVADDWGPATSAVPPPRPPVVVRAWADDGVHVACAVAAAVPVERHRVRLAP